MLRKVSLAAITCLASCGVRSRPTTSSADIDTVLTTLGADTVSVHTNGGARILWTTSTKSGRLVRWSSGDLVGSLPRTTLRYVNHDTIPDLFITLDYEEMISGALLLGTPTGARPVFRSVRAVTCAVPELRDVNSDGLVDIVERRVGTFSADECRDDLAAQACMRVYRTMWLNPVIQLGNGNFVQDSSRLGEFFRAADSEYTESSKRLADDISRAHTPSPRCNTRLLTGIQTMARRAAALAQLGASVGQRVRKP